MPEVRASVAGHLRQQADQLLSVDGRYYSRETEDELNRLAHLVLNTDNGRRFMDYLKNITLNAPFDHSVSNDTLRHMEGQRFLVGVLVTRARKGAEE